MRIFKVGTFNKYVGTIKYIMPKTIEESVLNSFVSNMKTAIGNEIK
jgi:hypothetical protein